MGKRNRRRRLEIGLSMAKPNSQMSSPALNEKHESEKSEISTGAWEESGSDITGSAVSGSSVWTENSTPGDRSSRRALILQMAKARMKNNKELPVMSKISSATEQEDEADDTIFTEGNTTHDFVGELTGDL